MRPYTIEHLSDPSRDGPPDIFELVGILVHSGTAESGHYYSYTRERPSSGNSEVWVEFNDDVVTPWDPAQMEASCFGGPDYRAQFENNGVAYDKTYSAYMLFYQRSSALKKEQELMVQSGARCPLRVPLTSPSLEQHIQRENVSLLRRHCLYDPQQIQFVQVTLYHTRVTNADRCTEDHSLEDKAIKMAVSHLDQVASRTKDVPEFGNLLGRLLVMVRSCPRCAFAVYSYFNERNEAFRMLVQKNAESAVRKSTADLFLQTLQVIKVSDPLRYGIPVVGEDEPPEGGIVIVGALRIFKLFFDFFHVSIRSWPEVFGLMLGFVDMGPHERAMFLQHQFLKLLIYIVVADTSLEMPQQFIRMIGAVSRRMATRPASYENIIALIDVLISALHIPVNERNEPVLLDYMEHRIEANNGLVDRPFLFTKAESKLIHQDWARGQANIFVDKLIGINQNLSATYSILANLIRCSRLMEKKIFVTLTLAISNQITVHHSTPYLQAASQVFCRHATDVELIDRLVRHVSQQCMAVQNAEGRAFFEFQRDVFDGPREGSGEHPEDIVILGLENLPHWAPGLLGYFDYNVSNEVELFLHEKLFKYGPSPDLGDSVEDARRAEVIVEVARALGIQCLVFLRDSYVTRRVTVRPQLVVGLERVIKECSKFFDLEEAPVDDPVTVEFIKLTQSKLVFSFLLPKPQFNTTSLDESWLTLVN